MISQNFPSNQHTHPFGFKSELGLRGVNGINVPTQKRPMGLFSPCCVFLIAPSGFPRRAVSIRAYFSLARRWVGVCCVWNWKEACQRDFKKDPVLVSGWMVGEEGMFGGERYHSLDRAGGRYLYEMWILIRWRN